MLKVKTNALSEKGALRPAVRTVIKEAITGVDINLSNGSVENLTYMGNGDWYGPIAVCEDGTTVYGKISLTITTNDYKAPTKKSTVAKEPESIEVE